MSAIWAGLVPETSMWRAHSHAWLCPEWVFISGHLVPAPRPTPPRPWARGARLQGPWPVWMGSQSVCQGRQVSAGQPLWPDALWPSVTALLGADLPRGPESPRASQTGPRAALREHRVSTCPAPLLCLCGGHSERSRSSQVRDSLPASRRPRCCLCAW